MTFNSISMMYICLQSNKCDELRGQTKIQNLYSTFLHLVSSVYFKCSLHLTCQHSFLNIPQTATVNYLLTHFSDTMSCSGRHYYKPFVDNDGFWINNLTSSPKLISSHFPLSLYSCSKIKSENPYHNPEPWLREALFSCHNSVAISPAHSSVPDPFASLFPGLDSSPTLFLHSGIPHSSPCTR